jgi:hypothetical protein
MDTTLARTGLAKRFTGPVFLHEDVASPNLHQMSICTPPTARASRRTIVS